MKKMLPRLNLDRLGAYASAICAVHCLVTGVALGLLSYAGLGFIGSVTADIIFLVIAVAIASIAIVHGIKRHHSYRPALVFVLGLTFVVLGHFVFRHEHTEHDHPIDAIEVLSTFFSVAGGLCFVLFHVMNMRLQHRCGCDRCSGQH